jgi:hypothetical protein
MQQPDLVQDAMLHGQRRRDSMLSFVNAAIRQRISFHRDATGLSVLLLGGVVTLLSLSSRSDQQLVRTSWLLYVAGALLVINAVLALMTRIILLGHLQDMVAAIEAQFSRIGDAVKNIRSVSILKADDQPSKLAVAIDKLVEAEGPIQLPQLNKVGEKAHNWVAYIFISALIAIALSLLVYVN